MSVEQQGIVLLLFTLLHSWMIVVIPPYVVWPGY